MNDRKKDWDNNADSFGEQGVPHPINSPKKKINSKKPKKKKQPKFFSTVFIVLLVCFAVVFSWTGYVASYVYPLIWGDLGNEKTAVVTDEQKVSFEKGQFTVLMMGCDARPGETASRSDTLMVAFVDLNEKRVRLVSIPRDTYVEIPTSGEHTKINHAYAFGGIDLTKKTLKENFDINIDYTAEVDFQGFRDVIDALGGVTIDVPMRMDYAAEGIDLQPGLQTLDGDQSLQFCRFRGDGQGDIGRVARQQEFITTLKDQLLSMGTMLKIPDLCSAIKNNVVTNLTGTQLLQILMSISDGFDLITVEPPGEGRYQDGVSYYFLYENQSEEFFNAVNNYQPTAQEIKAQEKAAGGSDPNAKTEENNKESTEGSNEN
ncbi:MAG: LCP family protein [Clostridiales bacterium]